MDLYEECDVNGEQNEASKLDCMCDSKSAHAQFLIFTNSKSKCDHLVARSAE
jgi:hypothetical protein